MQLVTVRVELGPYVLQGREVEYVGVTQAVGDHARCTLAFDRDPRLPGPVTALRLGDLANTALRVVFASDAGDGPGECVAFEGQVRSADATYQPSGVTRFSISALSASYVLGEHVDRSYRRDHTVGQLVEALGATSAGALPAGEVRDYVQPGQSAWAVLAAVAAGEGLQLRPTWPRSPGAGAAPAPAEVGAGFADVTHTVVWGRDLTGFSTTVEPSNPSVTGAFYDPSVKHDHRFVVRATPSWLGGASPVVSAAARTAESDAQGGEPGHVEVGGAGGTRARTLAEFRERLTLESQRRLGAAVVATGSSAVPALRAGDRIDVWVSAAAAAGALDGDDADGDATPTMPGAWVNGPEDADRTGVFGLVRVTHRWDHGLYENQFTATPWSEYAPAPAAAVAHGGRVAGATKGLAAGGFALALVVENADPKNRGRVKVRYPWMDDGTETAWIRVSAPGAGNHRGLGWLPQVGDEVVVAAVAGDPEHPVVVGSVWNGIDVAAHYPERTHVVTVSGNTLALIEEGADDETIELHTPQGRTAVQLAANNGSPVVTVYSDGDISLEAPNGQVRITAKTMLAHVDETDQTQVGGAHTRKVQGAVTIESGARVALRAGSDFISTAGGLMHAHAAGVHTLTGATVAKNPPGAPAPNVEATVPAAAASLWGPRPVPQPGPGVSTQDPRSGAAIGAGGDPAAPDKDVVDPQSAGGDAAAPAPAHGAPHGAGVTSAADERRREHIKSIMRRSPTAANALNYLERHDHPFVLASNQGTFYDATTGRVTLDRSQSDVDLAIDLVHETNHAHMDDAGMTGNIAGQSRDAYVQTMLQEEAMGTLLEEQARTELEGMDKIVGIPTDSPLDKAYYDAQNNARNAVFGTATTGTADLENRADHAGTLAGLSTILHAFQSGQVVTSVDGQTYPTYYGDAWDRANPNGP